MVIAIVLCPRLSCPDVDECAGNELLGFDLSSSINEAVAYLMMITPSETLI